MDKKRNVRFDKILSFPIDFGFGNPDEEYERLCELLERVKEVIESQAGRITVEVWQKNVYEYKEAEHVDSSKDKTQEVQFANDQEPKKA